MLILSRKKDESIIIGDNIEIKILEIDGGSRVSIGIEAPKNVEILRKELYEEVENENKSAAVKSILMEDIKSLFRK